MTGQKKLLILWAFLLLMTTLYPGAQCKRGSGFWGRGKGGGSDGSKAHSSQTRGFSNQGLKLAGAAAAGALGGAATGYGLGSLGKTRHGSGHKTKSSEKDLFYQGFHNKSQWRLFKSAAAPAPMSNIFLTLGPVVPFLIVAWIRNV